MKVISLISMFLALAINAQAQTADDEKAASEAYSRCVTIQRDREATSKLCKAYLEKYTNDDYKHRQAAEKFVREYERAMAYAKALQAYALSQPGPWFIYEPDVKLELPNMKQTVGEYKIQIERQFNNAGEEAMIRKAEAVYGGQFRYIDSMRSMPESWGGSLPDEIVPLWGMVGNDNVMMTDVITASGIKYYRDLSISARERRSFRNVFQMVSTSLKYSAVVKHYDEWEHAYAKYHDIYVADLNLEWSSTCGGLCGIGFTRNKLVVFDKNGKLIEMYLDAPVNQGFWVS